MLRSKKARLRALDALEEGRLALNEDDSAIVSVDELLLGVSFD